MGECRTFPIISPTRKTMWSYHLVLCIASARLERQFWGLLIIVDKAIEIVLQQDKAFNMNL